MTDEGATTTPDDLRALVSLAGHHADRTVLDTVQGLHRAISGRAFRAVPGSGPVQVAHDAISDVVYGSVRVGLRTASAVGDLALAAAGRRPREVRWSDVSPGRGQALAIVHGVVGDRFATDHPALDLPVTVRVADRDVPVTADGLRAAFPAATPRVAVLLHGLTESERSWDAPVRRRRPPPEAAGHEVEQLIEAATGDDPTGPHEDADAVVLPDVLTDLGWTPVRLRYGTGRAIGTNGVELAALLEDLVAAWPGGVAELTLVGHSMGGLVARSAGAVGLAAGHAWVDRVAHTVSLGTPHLGSWLERAANAGTRLLQHVPEGAVVARVIDTRARGIKDLRYGALDDTSWGDGVVHADGIGGLDGRLAAPLSDPPLLPDAVHHLVAGRLTRSPDHPVTRLFGDLLVTRPSALGRDASRSLHGGRIVTLELAAGHFRLLRDPRVAAHLRRHLA